MLVADLSLKITKSVFKEARIELLHIRCHSAIQCKIAVRLGELVNLYRRLQAGRSTLSPMRALRVLSGYVRKLWWALPMLLVLVAFVAFYLGYIPVKGNNFEQRGQFGDSFGVLNSLFSGLGFGGVIITLLYQQKQITLQEKEVTARRKFDETQHYEELFYRLLSLYSKTLGEVTNKNRELTGRNVLRGSIDRAYRVLREQGVNNIPHSLRIKHDKNNLSTENQDLIDYFYFRNFKILRVELERQKRLVETFKMLLKHTVRALPAHLDGQPYFDLLKAQLNHTETSYFFLIALTFTDEYSLRELLADTGLYHSIANTKILRVHEMMHKEFWGIDLELYKYRQQLPISDNRIDRAIRIYTRTGLVGADTDLKKYTPSKVKVSSSKLILNESASNEESFEDSKDGD